MATKQNTGHVGVFYVCYKLTCLGWNVLPTSRNAEGVDIFVYSQDGKRSFGIEVKTRDGTSKHHRNVEVKNPDCIPAKFWIIVQDSRDEPKTYILKSDEIAKFANDRCYGKEKKYMVTPSDYAHDKFMEKWERLGNPSSDDLPDKGRK